MRIAINGFGRIGRLFLRAALKNRLFTQHHEVVAINDPGGTPDLFAHLFQFDSVHRKYAGSVSATPSSLVVDGHEIRFTMGKDPTTLPWKELGVDLVVESTGVFTDREKAQLHLTAGAKKVLITAPAKSPDVTIVLGANESLYDPRTHAIISNASCTTNSMAAPLKVIADRWGISRGFMTTVHSYTNDQRILDLPHKDLRRARAAALSIIPTSTGAAKAIGEVVPSLKGKMDGIALRVPTPDGSITDMTLQLETPATKEEINKALRDAAAGPLRGIIEYSELPLVSTDIVGNPHSAIIDGLSTNVIGNLVKVFSWYDNEWGYSNRCVDIVNFIALREQGLSSSDALAQAMAVY